MDTLAFDPAEYLDTEEARRAYLADARDDGPEAVARAEEVVSRARAMHSTALANSERRLA